MQETSDDARTRIVEAAFELFYRPGHSVVGVDRVIAEAGVAKATFYRHFPAKDDLIAAYVALRDERYLRWIEARVAELSPELHRRPLAVFDALRERCEDDGFNGCAFGNVVAALDAPSHPARDAAREHKATMSRFLTKLLRDAGEEPPQSADHKAAALLLLIDGAVTTVAREGDPSAIDLARDLAAQILG